MKQQKFKSKKSFEDAKASDAKAPRVDELVDMFKFPPKKWVSLRFLNPLVSYGTHWIETKKQNGDATKFPKTCLAYDQETEDHNSEKPCPWCDAQDDRISFQREYFINAIVRDIEEDGPGKKNADPNKAERKTGIKDKDSKAWTPVRVIRLTPSVIREIKKLGGLNRHKDKKTGEKKAYPVTHEKYGCDINIMYDPDEKTPAKMYTIQKGDSSPLTEDQEAYLMYQIEDLKTPDNKADATKEYKRWLEKMGKGKGKKGADTDDEDDDDSDSDDEDDDEDDEPKSKKGKGKPDSKKSKKSKKDEDDEDEDSDDDEEDEDEKPAKKGKASAKSKKDDDDEDDDEDSDDDEDEDEDDDEPKSKSKSKVKGKKSSKDEDDEDDDLDDEDDDEDDEPKSKKSAAKSKKSKKDEDDEDEDDDDDEDEKPAKKGKGKADKKGKKSKSDDEDDDLDDDDELDDDEDEDEDDEDEKPAKKGKGKKSKAKPKSKKSKKDDDDEDEDEDDDD